MGKPPKEWGATGGRADRGRWKVLSEPEINTGTRQLLLSRARGAGPACHRIDDEQDENQTREYSTTAAQGWPGGHEQHSHLDDGHSMCGGVLVSRRWVSSEMSGESRCAIFRYLTVPNPLPDADVCVAWTMLK